MKFLILLLIPMGAQATQLDCEFIDTSKSGVNIILKGGVDKKNELKLTTLEYADDQGDMLGNYQGTEPVENKSGELIYKSAIADDDSDYGKIYTLYLEENFRSKSSVKASLELGGWSRGNEYGGETLDGNCTVK